ncbi:MAG: sigma-70 family RNA polymerase sigma factor [Bacteroidia bacterium]|nr:sigma-70 family RNA polymerase sigma factor [Bacteroidia bacterium]
MKETSWWEQLRQGNKEALSHIYHEHIGLLINYGRKFTKNDQLVEDAVHDLFVDLWQKHQNLGQTDSVARYLLGSLRRRIIRQDQKVKKHLQQDLDPDLYNFHVSLDVEKLMVLAEGEEMRSQQLKNAINGLSKRQKEAIYLRFQSEMDYEQVGEIMNISYQSARNLIHNAIKVLRKTMTLIILLISSSIFKIFF